MSGIFGLFNRDSAPCEPPLVATLLERLRHRGTQPGRAYTAGDVALGMVPFPTTPESVGDLAPRVDARCILCADARLDNRAELLSELQVEELGHSDSALILDAYRRWGPSSFAKLIGDFALCLWDAHEQALFLARDALSARPLFYAEVGRRFLCASEMFALFADPDLPRRPNFDQMALFLVDEYLERDQTLYEGVRSVPSGHYLKVTRTQISLTRFWNPEAVNMVRYRSPADYAHHYRQLLDQAARARLERSTSRITIEVSGGIDSSSMVALSQRLGTQGSEPLFLHARYPGLPCDEVSFAESVARRWGITLFELFPSPPEAYPMIPERLWPDQLCAPGSDSSDWEYRHITERGSRIVLTGFGTDELMRRMGFEVLDPLLRRRWSEVREATGLSETLLSKRALKNLYTEGIRPMVPGSLVRAYRWARNRSSRGQAFTKRARAAVASHRASLEDLKQRSNFGSRAQREVAFTVTHSYHTCYFMNFVDRVSSRHPVELRHPFFDRRIVEYLLGIPDARRSGAFHPKALIMEALGDDLPKEVRNRSIRTDYSPWMQRVLFDEQGANTRQLTSKSRLVELGLLRSEALGGNLRGSSSFFDVCNFFTLELWVRRNF